MAGQPTEMIFDGSFTVDIPSALIIMVGDVCCNLKQGRESRIMGGRKEITVQVNMISNTIECNLHILVQSAICP